MQTVHKCFAKDLSCFYKVFCVLFMVYLNGRSSFYCKKKKLLNFGGSLEDNTSIHNIINSIQFN